MSEGEVERDEAANAPSDGEGGRVDEADPDGNLLSSAPRRCSGELTPEGIHFVQRSESLPLRDGRLAMALTPASRRKTAPNRTMNSWERGGSAPLFISLARFSLSRGSGGV